MPYKILQTIENGQIKLSAIPEQWEAGGVLKYPKKKYERLRQNENSLPKESWATINCIVKRANLSFGEAEAELDLMCKTSDTEMERATDTDTEDNRHQTKKRKKGNEDSNTDNDFMKMANECLNTDVIYTAAINEQNEVLYLAEDAESVQFTIPEIPVKKPSNVESKLDSLTEKVNSLSENIIIVQKNQQFLHKTQQDILLSLSHINTQFEELIKKVHIQPQVNECDVGFKRISDQESFDNFEKMLEDVNFSQNIMKKMCAICGTHRGKGINNAYALVDVLFERPFLQQCSWAGGSRTDSSKICFKSRTNTLKFFFTIINKADENFTFTDTQKFFKIILRNSRQRVESQQERKSVTKSRQRKGKPAPRGLVISVSEQKLVNSELQKQPNKAPLELIGLPEVSNIEISIQKSSEEVQSIGEPGPSVLEPLIQESGGDILSKIVNDLSIKPPAQVEAIVQPEPSKAEPSSQKSKEEYSTKKLIVQPESSDAEILIQGEEKQQSAEICVVVVPEPLTVEPLILNSQGSMTKDLF